MGVSKGVDRATHLVEQLLTLARLDPEAHIDKICVKLRSLVVEVVSGLALDAIKKRLDLVVNDGPDLEIQGNPSMLAILVRNLVDNAIRYTPSSGFVHVAIERLKGQAQLIVEDSGPGLSEGQRKLIAERFSRMSRPSGEGSGLGLSISSRIGELHRAKIDFGPGQNGRGLRVAVLFPE
ncbi:MAG: ATP-binding protein [Proteobacteria bacterium]|nr:ATP-binding protein [Pseudomonadota bacterium]